MSEKEQTTKKTIDPITCVIVGVGGIGTALADDLVKMLEYRAPGSFLVLVDGDTFEEKNKERQNFVKMGNKAEAKTEELMGRYPSTTIVPVPKWVVETVEASDEEEDTEDNPDATTSDSPKTKIEAAQLLDEDQIVFAVVDNYKARALLCEVAGSFNNIDVFMGGNDDELFGSVYHYQRRNGEDVTAPPSYWHPELEDPPDRNPGDLSCQERAQIEGGTQLVATNRMVAAYMLLRVQHCILEGNAPSNGASFFFDGSDASFSSDERPPIPGVNGTQKATNSNIKVEVASV